jgi:hypothetical protein
MRGGWQVLIGCHPSSQVSNLALNLRGRPVSGYFHTQCALKNCYRMHQYDAKRGSGNSRAHGAAILENFPVSPEAPFQRPFSCFKGFLQPLFSELAG